MDKRWSHARQLFYAVMAAIDSAKFSSNTDFSVAANILGKAGCGAHVRRQMNYFFSANRKYVGQRLTNDVETATESQLEVGLIGDVDSLDKNYVEAEENPPSTTSNPLLSRSANQHS